MKRTKILLLWLMTSGLFLSSCSISNRTMKTPNYHIEFYKSDFEYSKQVEAEATSVRVLGIDWKRLFKWENGEIESDRFKSEPAQSEITTNFVTDNIVGTLTAVVPVIGDYGKGKVSSYALYNLMQKNPGYDVVIYPQYETNKFIVPLFYSKRTVKVTARLGRIK
ncbi:hypothetical protein SAMN05444280_11654 [Tangfeifania diversioriginum]|uniref:Lipoprotein n=1 Tax=Tangfeifania diversioriginum TaxID=1168035 RepID=A0A1M6ID89_9BACT|nr:hypothetical protein [Tangfeifania diversioriginum]SHJ32387.1 hypothetical protein SAMN05444280_11654 [Tangfeifania diversioriginum]